MHNLSPSSPQYFVFDFHVPPDVMFDKIIKISVSAAQGSRRGCIKAPKFSLCSAEIGFSSSFLPPVGDPLEKSPSKRDLGGNFQDGRWNGVLPTG